MRVLRERWFLLTCFALAGAVVVGAVVVGAAWAASSTVRAWWWIRVAAQPLDAEELAALEGCDEVGWTAWVKVLATDPDLTCGEAWAAHALATTAGGSARRAWLEGRIAAPETAPGARIRAATALALAGVQPSLEPIFLLPELEGGRGDAWIAAAADDEAVALQLGPRMVALRATTAAERGEIEPREALPAVRWLATVEDPAARAVADRTLTRLTSVDEGLSGRLRERRRRHLPVGEPPVPERDGLEACDDLPCLEERIRVLEAQVAESADGGPPAETAEELPTVPPELAEPGTLRAEALAWEVEALRRWIEAAPDPVARRTALVARAGRGSLTGLGWDGSGTPWAVADLLSLLGDEPVRVRADRADAVWIPVGWGWVPRSCGSPGTAAPSTTFEGDAVRARVILELADERDRPRALARARALDPGLPLPPPTGDPVAFRIGAALAPPLAAEGDRGVGPDGPWCR